MQLTLDATYSILSTLAFAALLVAFVKALLLLKSLKELGKSLGLPYYFAAIGLLLGIQSVISLNSIFSQTVKVGGNGIEGYLFHFIVLIAGVFLIITSVKLSDACKETPKHD